MGLFKTIFGGPGGAGSGRDDDPLGPRFDADWYRAVRRFAIVAGYGPESFQFNLRHPETGEIMVPHLGIAPYFDDWKQIRSPWDRIDLFFRIILSTHGVENFHVWAVANVLTACRRPQQALDMLQKVPPAESDSEYYARHCGAFARTLIPLGHPKEALEWAQTASAADPADDRLRLLLADALRFAGQAEDATAIYSGLMANAAPSPDEAPDPVADLFNRLFALETGAVPSPFFAIDIAGSIEDPDQADQLWTLGEAEFYDSPQFRMQHAYHRVARGQLDQAFAKLAALVGEMPWLREAQLNLLQLFNHLDPEGARLMPELRQHVEQAIRDNGWTTDGMTPLSIPSGE